jgi:hypothetical protein
MMQQQHPKQERPGEYQGRHFTTYIDEIQSLKKSRQSDQLETLLRGLIATTEAEAYALQTLAAPAYFEELAILYRKLGRDDAELAILERYQRLPANLRHSQRLAQRLIKVQARIAKKKQSGSVPL